MKYLILDFNGTVVDDVDISLACINSIRDEYLHLPPIDLKTYRKVFTFPVRKYYEAVGFDFDQVPFSVCGTRWMELYHERFHFCGLYDGVKELLFSNRNKGNYNILLSASKQDNLIAQLDELNIRELFDEVLGISDHYAEGKLDIALSFIKGKEKNDCLMVGDTLHDLEVAQKMGIECILVADGHQSKEVLLRGNCKVIDHIKELVL